MARSIEEILTPETGKILRKAREARGLSVSDVSSRLRINPLYLQGMESGDLSPLPPGPYRKAFITEYARFLNIKLDDLQSIIPEERSEGIISSAVSAMPGVAKKMTQSAVKTTESAFKKVEEGVKDAVEEITARDLWEEAEEVRKERLGIQPRPQEDPRISIRKKDIPLPEEQTPPPNESRRARRLEFEQKKDGEEYSPIVEEDEDDEIHPGLSRTTKVVIGLLVVIASVVGYSIFTKKQQPAVIAPEEKISVKPPEQKPKVVLPTKKDTVIAIPKTDSLIFIISAKDTVWVSISPDIGKGFRGKLAKGEVKKFTAKEKYFIFLGNQKAVSMTLDGKPLANLPTIPGSKIVVRNAILTRERVIIPPSEHNKPPEEHAGKKNTKNPTINKPIHPVKPLLPR